jgi:hypothetical protein
MKKHKVQLQLAWIPRERNQHADDLTNDRFENFDPSRRIEVDLQSLPWLILPTLMQEAEQLKKELEERRLQKRTVPGERERGKKRRKQEALRVTDPW